MAGWGSGLVSEWAAATGENYNAEWAGAAPGEYMARMEGQARAWRNNQLDAQAQREAQELRERLARDMEAERTRQNTRIDDFQRWADLQMDTARGSYGSFQADVDRIRRQYNEQLGRNAQATSAAEQFAIQERARQQAERELNEVKRKGVSGVINQYSQNILRNNSYVAGGIYDQRLSSLRSDASNALAGYQGSTNLAGASSAAKQLQQQYEQRASQIQREYQNLVADSTARIGEARNRSTRVYSDFDTNLRGAISNYVNPTQGVVQDDIGTLATAQAFDQQYQGLLGAGFTQANQAYAQQGDVYNALQQQAYSPGADYATARDTELANANKYEYVTQLYNPSFTGIQGAYNALNPLAADALATYEKTYAWNPEKLAELQNPILQSQQAATGQLSTANQSFSSNLGGLLSGLSSGLYGESELANKISTQNSVNQQLRDYEQQMMGTLSQYYNTFSDFANKAQNEFTNQKAFRINEKESINARQQQQRVDRQVSRSRGRAERGRVTQLSRVAGKPSQNLLSLLTRGNY